MITAGPRRAGKTVLPGSPKRPAGEEWVMIELEVDREESRTLGIDVPASGP